MSTLLDFLGDDNDPAEGERLRDEAFERLLTHRPVLIRTLQREFLTHLLRHGPSTTDSLRAIVPIPPGTDPRVVGCAVQNLANHHGLTIPVDDEKSCRKVAHARRLRVWALRDPAAARRWLGKYAAPEAGPSADPSDPFAF